MEIEKETKLIKNIGIIYHYPCMDGAYAAINAYLYYYHFRNGNQVDNKTTKSTKSTKSTNSTKSTKCKISFFPSNSHNRLSEVEFKKFDKIYILDKGLNDEDFKYIIDISINFPSSKIVLIDHHNSSIEQFECEYKDAYSKLNNVELLFESDGTRAASGLTFEYFEKKAKKNYSEDIVAGIYSDKYKKV